MPVLWVGENGLEVEGRVLDKRQVLTVYQWSNYGERIVVADCFSVAQVKQYVPNLAMLVEVKKLPVPRPAR